jgi:hypothetical protein
MYAGTRAYLDKSNDEKPTKEVHLELKVFVVFLEVLFPRHSVERLAPIVDFFR